MAENKNNPSIWATIPDTFKGCAALITALTGLLGVLFTVGLCNAQPPPTPPPNPPSIVTAKPVVFEPSAKPVTVAPTAKPVTVAPPAPTADPLVLVKPRLINAIQLGDGAEIRAQRYLDPSPLYGSFSGEMLKTELAALEDLKRNGVYADHRLENQQFLSFKLLPDGVHAEVQANETWSTVYYIAATNACKSRIPSHQVPQTIHLEYVGGAWLIYSVVFDGKAPASIAC